METAKTRSGSKQTVGEMSKAELISIIGECLKPVNETVSALRKEVAKLTSDVEDLTREVASKDTLISKMEVRLEECEQYARRNCLRIFGLPEKPKEDTNKLVLDVAKKIGANIAESQIDRSHRVGKIGSKPRPVIVKFIGYTPRRAMFTNKKSLKGSGITIREDLTKQRLDLLKQAAEFFEEKNVWTQDEVIKVKIHGVERPIRLKCEDELLSARIKYHRPNNQ